MKYGYKPKRLKCWDYTTPWWYFITICTKNHINYFGEVKNGKMIPNRYGNIADSLWQQIPEHHLEVEIDEYVIMPNHIHGIIIINERKNVACNVSTTDNFHSNISPKPGSLSAIVRSFKSAVSKQIHTIGNNNFHWQSRFYDRIIRNERELFQIRKYIQQNPLKFEIEHDIENLDI